MYTLLSSICYPLSWPPQQSTVYILMIIPHHCGRIPQISCTLHWGEHSYFKLPHQLKYIPSAVPSVIYGIFLISLRIIHITSLFSSDIDRSNTFNFLSPHNQSQEIILSRKPISRSYYSLFPVNPSPEHIKVYFPSPHHQSQSQYIRLSRHPISRYYYSLFPVTPSPDPINNIIPSPHQ